MIAFLIHAHPSMLARYESALGCRVVPVNSHGSQLSAGYDEGRGIARDCPTVDALVKRYAKDAGADEPVVLVAYSAGCWLARAVLRDADSRIRTAAAVFLDGLHSSSLAPLRGVIDFAAMARIHGGSRVCVISHTQIKPKYASTAETADLLLTGLRLSRGGRSADVHDGGFTLRAYPGVDTPAHARQLREIGPALCAELVAPIVTADLPRAKTDPAPAPDVSLGVRALAWSRREMARENPPAPLTKVHWFLPCERGGKRIWSALTAAQAKPLNHCAAAACAASAAVRVDGDVAPHGYRAAAKELLADAQARGTWRPAAMVRDGRWTPAPGDLAIYDRSQPGRSDTLWWGHVDRVTEVDAGRYRNLGANEGPRGEWVEQWTPFTHPRLLGFVEYPRVRADDGTPPLSSAAHDPVSEAHVRALVALTMDQAETEYWEWRREAT